MASVARAASTFGLVARLYVLAAGTTGAVIGGQQGHAQGLCMAAGSSRMSSGAFRVAAWTVGGAVIGAATAPLAGIWLAVWDSGLAYDFRFTID